MSAARTAPAAAKGAAKGAAALTSTRGKGKAARRNASKNASHVMEYLETLEAAKTLVTLETYMESEAIQLARVTRQSGAGRLKVTLQDGSTDVDVTIAGSLRFKGRAATKGDRSNCMNVNDLIVLHGPQAAGKIPREFHGRIEAAFTRLRVSYPKGFFAKGTADDGAAADDGFVWDTDEAAVTEAFAAAAKITPRGAAAVAAAADSDSEDEVDVDAI
jgi:hypothetical protein